MEPVRKVDKKALEKLYSENFSKLYIYVRHKVDTDERAEDICSESFVKAFEKIDSFKGKSSFKTWLYTISRNLIFDWYRVKGKETSLDEERLGFNPREEKIFKKSNKAGKLVNMILSNLKENYQEVLELRFLTSLSIKETAKVMGVTVNNVKVLQNRALKKAQKIALNIKT